MELEDFVESQGVSMDDFEAQCQQYAQAKVKQNLIIQGIMDAEGMTLDDEECLAIQDQLVEQYASGDLAALIDTYGQVAVDETIGLMRVEDFIIANANYDQTAGEDAEAADTEEDRPQMRLVKSRQPLVKQRKRNRILQMTVQTARKLTVMQMHRIPIQKIHPRRGQNNHDH